MMRSCSKTTRSGHRDEWSHHAFLARVAAIAATSRVLAPGCAAMQQRRPYVDGLSPSPVAQRGPQNEALQQTKPAVFLDCAGFAAERRC